MLLKITGAVLIVTAGTALGISRGMVCGLRIACLEEIKRAAMVMYSETEFGHTYLEPMCRRAAEVCSRTVGEIFNSFANALSQKSGEDIAKMWRDSVFNQIGGTHLASEDGEAIAALGKALGAGDINRQLAALKQLAEYSDFKCGELREASNKNQRLCRSVGMLLSLLTVILLL